MIRVQLCRAEVEEKIAACNQDGSWVLAIDVSTKRARFAWREKGSGLVAEGQPTEAFFPLDSVMVDEELVPGYVVVELPDGSSGVENGRFSVRWGQLRTTDVAPLPTVTPPPQRERPLALLVLIAGRQQPNLLAARQLRPNLIVPIASPDDLKASGRWAEVEKPLRDLCGGNLEIPIAVDPYRVKSTQEACQNVIEKFNEVEWIFNLTCGTKPMSLGAYQEAVEKQLSAFYFDSSSSTLELLSGDENRTNDLLAGLGSCQVSEYVEAYGRHLRVKGDADRLRPIGQDPSKKEVATARFIADHRREMQQLLSVVRREISRASKDKRPVTAVNFTAEKRRLLALCRRLHNDGYVELLEESDRSFSVRACQGEPSNFFNGGWLEIFVWSCAREAGVFEDVVCGHEVAAAQPNEMDVAATHNGNLFVIECKTDAQVFSSKEGYLRDLVATTNVLGGNYVGRLLVTLEEEPNGSPYASEYDKKKRPSYESFKARANDYHIHLVTGDLWPDLVNILKREAGKVPADRTFSRI